MTSWVFVWPGFHVGVGPHGVGAPAISTRPPSLLPDASSISQYSEPSKKPHGWVARFWTVTVPLTTSPGAKVGFAGVAITTTSDAVQSGIGATVVLVAVLVGGLVGVGAAVVAGSVMTGGVVAVFGRGTGRTTDEEGVGVASTVDDVVTVEEGSDMIVAGSLGPEPVTRRADAPPFPEPEAARTATARTTVARQATAPAETDTTRRRRIRPARDFTTSSSASSERSGTGPLRSIQGKAYLRSGAELLAQRRPSTSRVLLHRVDRDAEDLRHLALVQVGEVAQGDDLSLAG